jgi:hypothetical protein
MQLCPGANQVVPPLLKKFPATSGFNERYLYLQRPEPEILPMTFFLPIFIVFSRIIPLRVTYIWLKTDEVTSDCRRLRNEELHGRHSLSNIITVMKSGIRWVGLVARVGDRRGAHGDLVGKIEGLNPQRRPCVDRIILK